MHIASIFHCPSTGDARECGFNLAQYNLSLIESILEQDASLRVTIITSLTGNPLLLRPSLAGAVETGRLTIRPLLKRTTLSLLSLAWRVRWGAYDVAHFQHETYHYGGPLSVYFFPLLLGWIRLRARTIATLHHVIDPLQINATFTSLYASRLPPCFIRWGFKLFYRLTGWLASSIIVHEPCDRTILLKGYGLKLDTVAVIPHGARDTANPRSFDRTEARVQFGVPTYAERVFGFFSYFDRTKGIDVLIPEFLEYRKTHPRDVLVIAGTRNPYHLQQTSVAEELDSLHARAIREGAGSIIWTGFLSPERAARFYGVVDCVLAPYRIFNGGSAAIAKCIGARVPILLAQSFAPCTSNPALLFSLEEHGLSSALRSFADSPDRRMHILEQIDEWREQRLWPAVGRSVIALYRRLAHSTAQPILLLGAYGQRNLGDELLLAQCLTMLPRERCVVVSSDPERTSREHAVSAIPRSGSPWKLLKAVLRSRAVVAGGGDQFKVMKPLMPRAKYALLILDALLASVTKLLGKNLVYAGVGIGNIQTAPARFLTRWTLRRAHAVTFRDAESFRLARKLAPRSNIALGADLAFLTSPPSKNGTSPPPLSFLYKSSPPGPLSRGEGERFSNLPFLLGRKGLGDGGLQQREKKELGDRNFVEAGEGHGEGQQITLGIAPCAHLDDAKVYDRVMQELAKASDAFLNIAPERNVTLLPFQTGFAPKNDIAVSREILARMERKNHCSVAEDLNLQTVRRYYQSLDCLWGMRLHSVILACLHAVPFVALIYDVKVKNFLREIGCEEWGIPLDGNFSAEKLFALQERLRVQAGRVRQHLRARAAYLLGRARADAEVLRMIADEVVCPAEDSTVPESPSTVARSRPSPAP